jgi:hypothetical protein
VIVALDVEIADVSGAVFRDADGEFAAGYGTSAYLIRPDGYVSFRTSTPTASSLRAHLSRTLTGSD